MAFREAFCAGLRRDEKRRDGWGRGTCIRAARGPFDGTSLAEELEALHKHGLRHYYKTVPDVDV